jgi:hypothetical protein
LKPSFDRVARRRKKLSLRTPPTAHDKGGHRVRAIEPSDQAIAEVQAGISAGMAR